MAYKRTQLLIFIQTVVDHIKLHQNLHLEFQILATQILYLISISCTKIKKNYRRIK